MIVCSAENPGLVGQHYRVPYNESVDGYGHAYSTSKGIKWTRTPNHPEDPKCPGCATGGKS